MLEFIEEALDPVSQTVERRAESVARVGCAAVGDDCHGFPGFDRRPDPFGVIGFVARHEAVGRQPVFEQNPCRLAVVPPAGAQGEAQRQAMGVDRGVDPGRQAAPGTTHATIRTPLFEPAACW